MRTTLQKKSDAEPARAQQHAGTVATGRSAAGGAPAPPPPPALRLYDDAAQMEARRQLVQRAAEPRAPAVDPAAVHAAARAGLRAPASPLPFGAVIQRAFGRHPVGGVRAHRGALASSGATAMGAAAYTQGEHVVVGAGGDLRTVAHEAAHVVQQRAGVRVPGGVGRVGDPYERHADAVAQRVVAGRSAQDLLDRPPGAGTAPGSAPVQRASLLRAEGRPGPDPVQYVLVNVRGDGSCLFYAAFVGAVAAQMREALQDERFRGQTPDDIEAEVQRQAAELLGVERERLVQGLDQAASTARAAVRQWWDQNAGIALPQIQADVVGLVNGFLGRLNLVADIVNPLQQLDVQLEDLAPVNPLAVNTDRDEPAQDTTEHDTAALDTLIHLMATPPVQDGSLVVPMDDQVHSNNVPDPRVDALPVDDSVRDEALDRVPDDLAPRQTSGVQSAPPAKIEGESSDVLPGVEDLLRQEIFGAPIGQGVPQGGPLESALHALIWERARAGAGQPDFRLAADAITAADITPEIVGLYEEAFVSSGVWAGQAALAALRGRTGVNVETHFFAAGQRLAGSELPGRPINLYEKEGQTHFQVMVGPFHEGFLQDNPARVLDAPGAWDEVLDDDAMMGTGSGEEDDWYEDFFEDDPRLDVGEQGASFHPPQDTDDPPELAEWRLRQFGPRSDAPTGVPDTSTSALETATSALDTATSVLDTATSVSATAPVVSDHTALAPSSPQVPATLTDLAKSQLRAAREKYAEKGTGRPLQAPTMAVGRYRTRKGDVLKTSNQRNLPGTRGQAEKDKLQVLPPVPDYPNMHGEMLGAHHHLDNAVHGQEGTLVEMGASQEICFQCELVLQMLGVQYDETHISRILYGKWQDPTGLIRGKKGGFMPLLELLETLGISRDEARARLVARLSKEVTAGEAGELADRILSGELQGGKERERLFGRLATVESLTVSGGGRGKRKRSTVTRASRATKGGRRILREQRKQRAAARKGETSSDTPESKRQKPNTDDEGSDSDTG